MKSIVHNNKTQIISIFLLIFTSIILIGCFWKLNNMDITVPNYYYGGDDYFALNTAKTIKDTGWIFENKNLGAPYGTEYYDYPSGLTDNFDTLITKLLVSITGNIAVTVNLQFLLLFPLISVICYLVLTHLKIKNIVAICGALTYAFSPYIFYRSMVHNSLSTYQFVPLSILLCIWLYQDDEFYNINKNFLKYKKNIIAILFCILIANNGMAYYPFFTCFFLFITTIIKSINTKKIKYFFNGIFLIITTVIMFVINFIPILTYLLKEGANSISIGRSWIGSEIYGLKIIQLFIPLNSHGISLLDRIIKGYNTNAPLVNENTGSYLGIVGIVGFLILLVMLFIKNNDNKLIEKLKFLSEMNIAAVLLASIGGFGTIFSIIVSPLIRGYNRISIFILFICILTVCLILSDVFNYMTKKKLLYSIIIIFFGISILEQSPETVPNYEYVKSSYNNDKAFIQTIENNVSKGAMIFQLPYHAYPEGGVVNSMPDYHLLTGYLHSNNLKWSYGGIKGRKSDLWNQNVASLDVDTMVKALSLAGFEGIYIDKGAYTENDYNNLAKSLAEVLKIEPSVSANNQLVFFNMNNYNNNYASLYSEKELYNLKQKVYNQNTYSFRNGFYSVEGEKPNQWIWISNNAEILLNNPSKKDKMITTHFNITSGYIEKSNLYIYINNKLFKEYKVNSDVKTISLQFVLKKGNNVISFKTDSQKINAPQDSRELYLKITNFDFTDNHIELK